MFTSQLGSTPSRTADRTIWSTAWIDFVSAYYCAARISFHYVDNQRVRHYFSRVDAFQERVHSKKQLLLLQCELLLRKTEKNSTNRLRGLSLRVLKEYNVVSVNRKKCKGRTKK